MIKLIEMLYKTNYLSQVILRLDFSQVENWKDNDISEYLKKIFLKEFSELKEIPNKGYTINLKSSTDEPIFEKTNDGLFYKFTKNENNDYIKSIIITSSYITLKYNGKYYNGFQTIIDHDLDLIIKCLTLLDINEILKMGLRYINEINENTENLIDSYKWVDSRFRMMESEKENHFLDECNENMIRSMSKLEYFIGDYKFIFQYGEFNSNYPSKIFKNNFVLDYDCQLMDIDNISNIKNNIKKMSSFIYKFFENSISDELRQKLEGEINDE